MEFILKIGRISQRKHKMEKYVPFLPLLNHHRRRILTSQTDVETSMAINRLYCAPKVHTDLAKCVSNCRFPPDTSASHPLFFLSQKKTIKKSHQTSGKWSKLEFNSFKWEFNRNPMNVPVEITIFSNINVGYLQKTHKKFILLKI